MPRGRQRSKSKERSSKEVNYSEEKSQSRSRSAVASVNKAKKRLISNNDRGNKRTVVDHGNEQKQKDIKKIKRQKSDKHLSARFVEDDQLIEMTVDKDEDAIFPSHDESMEISDSDSEVILNNQGSNLDNQNDESEEEEGLLPPSDDEIDQTVGNDQINKEQNGCHGNGKQNSLKQIDVEIKQKIKELHQLMEVGGLQESAKMLLDLPVMNITKGNGKGKKNELPRAQGQSNIVDTSTNQLKQNENMEIVTETNKNDNANIANRDKPVPISKSMETIYDIAVPRHESSSSEEELNVVSSDESGEVGNDPQKLANVDKQIEVLISDERKKQERRELGQQHQQRYEDEILTARPGTSHDQDNHGAVTEDKIQDLVCNKVK